MGKRIFTLLLIASIAIAVRGQNSALSMYLTGNDGTQGDIIMKTARATLTYDCSFFMTNGFWLTGGHDGGYSGFQDSPDKGNCYIFSIWDPISGTINAAYTGSGTVVERFGGEGTGLKSMNSTLGWTLGNWYTFVSRCWDVGNRTHFGYWVRDISGDKWTHLVTFDHPGTAVRFDGQTYSFLEDWLNYGSQKRRLELKDGYKRKTDGTWQSITSYEYSINTYDIENSSRRSWNYRTAYDAGTVSGAVYMQSGGNTTKSFTGTPPISFSNNPSPTPSNSAISFSISSVSTSSVSWSVPAASTPQFRYTIKVNGNQVATAIDPTSRSRSITASAGATVEIILEDILGRTSSQTATVSGGGAGTTVIAFSSQELVGENGAATNAIDNNSSTIWHTKWYNGVDNLPHFITLDLGANFSVTGLNYLPRQNTSNGRIKGYQIYVSTDNINWGSAVKSGNWTNNATEKKVTFNAKPGRYVKLVATSEVNGNQFVSAAEIKIATTVGLKNSESSNSSKQKVNPYYNPEIFSSKGCVLIKSTENLTVRVFNVLGGLVLQTNVAEGENSIAIANSGIYIVQVQNSKKQMFSKKIFVE